MGVRAGMTAYFLCVIVLLMFKENKESMNKVTNNSLWIDAKIDVPESSESVLLTIKGLDTVVIGYYSGEWFVDIPFDVLDLRTQGGDRITVQDQVTHWQYLPQPYK